MVRLKSQAGTLSLVLAVPNTPLAGIKVGNPKVTLHSDDKPFS
jgi:hypothetical protein